eukprot:1529485-Rhodomonas_salina.1
MMLNVFKNVRATRSCPSLSEVQRQRGCGSRHRTQERDPLVCTEPLSSAIMNATKLGNTRRRNAMAE